MKKLLLIIFVLFSTQLVKAQFHQDSIYFFMKLKNPKASFEINKKLGYADEMDYEWAFWIDRDNNYCSGFGIPGSESRVALNHIYRPAIDTTKRLVSLLDKQYFETNIYKVNTQGNAFELDSNFIGQLNYRVTGDTGIFIVAPRTISNNGDIDDNDMMMAQGMYYSALDTRSSEFTKVTYLGVGISDPIDDFAVSALDIIYARVYNTQSTKTVINTLVQGSVDFDSLGVIKTNLSGKAYFYSASYFASGTELIDSMVISNGMFSGNAKYQGVYNILVVPDAQKYGSNIAPMYYGNNTAWGNDSLKQICKEDTLPLNFTLKYNAAFSGINSIQGYVLDGYGPRKPGEPKRGAGVALEQIPGGSVAYKTTNNEGFYSFDNLPAGDFKVTVNIPGKTMTSEVILKLDASGNDVDTAVFFTTDNIIYVEDQQLTIDSAYASFGPEKRISENVSIFPNPSNGMFYVSCETKQNEPIEILLVDLQGREVYRKVTRSKIDGETKIPVNYGSELNPGFYLLRINHEGKGYTSSVILE